MAVMKLTEVLLSTTPFTNHQSNSPSVTGHLMLMGSENRASY